ncbi:IS21 family transposase [Sorangium sp. So ce362]|uniref:IS21 family transposase n=1 Tax=Sorangium sp. So ce362 TaxID=3133303 RepID=UPI003F5ECB39
MISEELRSRMRRLYFAEHWKVGTIAAELGVHHDTVRLAIDATRFVNTQYRAHVSVLDPYKSFIQLTLKDHPKLLSTRLYDMITSRGYAGSVVQLRRYVRAIRPSSHHEAFFRLRTLPGEQAQVDWGCFGTLLVGRAKRALSCFVMVLGWSRAVYAYFTLDQTLESFVRCHMRAFEALGGVPRALLYDNLKTAVLERQGDIIRFHPRLLELAGHYHFATKPCAPYRGNEKGKVERAIRYLRYSFFDARSFSSVADLNTQLAAWIAAVAHTRRVPGDPDGRLVAEALTEERPRLLPLPQHAFESDLVRPAASGKTPYLRFDLNDYSIPHALVRKPLTLIASEESVRIVDGKTVVAHHRRSYDRLQTVEDPTHLQTLADHKRHAHELRGRDRLRTACAHAEAFLDAIALRGGHLGGTTSRLLRLLDRFGAAPLDGAIADAFGRGALSAQSVAHVLDQATRAAGAPPPLEHVMSDDPRIHGLRITPHALGRYDALGASDPEERHE